MKYLLKLVIEFVQRKSEFTNHLINYDSELFEINLSTVICVGFIKPLFYGAKWDLYTDRKF